MRGLQRGEAIESLSSLTRFFITFVIDAETKKNSLNKLLNSWKNEAKKQNDSSAIKVVQIRIKS